ncbi:MAG TPA: hypothetical protein VLA12_13430 [Planctomycetaceae bacterium]|nr:hypothetical protein [Planctomycetaceae bacterium]
MSRRVRHSVALCLLVTWCVSSLMAMVWHPHDHTHAQCCQGDDCQKPASSSARIVHRHTHSHACGHSHSHHGHHHAHEPTEKKPEEDSGPHSPETCPSCQLLAISVVVPHRVEVPQFDSLVVSTHAARQSLIDRDQPTTLQLRGPPVTLMS